MGNSLTLFALTDSLLIAQEQLAASEFDEQTVLDTLEGLEGEVAQKMEGCLSIVRNMEALADQIKAAEAVMAARRKTIESRAEWLTEYVKSNMERASISKIECPYFQATIKKNPPKVIIDSMTEIPKGFINYPPPPDPSVDRKAVAESWKRGDPVPGTHMEQGTRLDIK